MNLSRAFSRCNLILVFGLFLGPLASSALAWKACWVTGFSCPTGVLEEHSHLDLLNIVLGISPNQPGDSGFTDYDIYIGFDPNELTLIDAVSVLPSGFTPSPVAPALVDVDGDGFFAEVGPFSASSPTPALGLESIAELTFQAINPTSDGVDIHVIGAPHSSIIDANGLNVIGATQLAMASIVPVPEPSTVALLSACAVLGCIRKRG